MWPILSKGRGKAAPAFGGRSKEVTQRSQRKRNLQLADKVARSTSTRWAGQKRKGRTPCGLPAGGEGGGVLGRLGGILVAVAATAITEERAGHA